MKTPRPIWDLSHLICRWYLFDFHKNPPANIGLVPIWRGYWNIFTSTPSLSIRCWIPILHGNTIYTSTIVENPPTNMGFIPSNLSLVFWLTSTKIPRPTLDLSQYGAGTGIFLHRHRRCRYDAGSPFYLGNLLYAYIFIYITIHTI